VQADVGPCLGGGYAAGVYALRQLITLSGVRLQQRGPCDQHAMQVYRDGQTIGPPLPDVRQGLILALREPDTYHPVLGLRTPASVILSDEPDELGRQLIRRAVLSVCDRVHVLYLLTLDDVAGRGCCRAARLRP